MAFILKASLFLIAIQFATSARVGNLFQFGHMIALATDLSPSDLNGYGCWCGLGGCGKAIDNIDACCQVHDRCYAIIENLYGCLPKVFNMYHYTAEPGKVECLDSQDTCNYKICRCDKGAVDCYYKNQGIYDAKKKLSREEKLQVCDCQIPTYEDTVLRAILSNF